MSAKLFFIPYQVVSVNAIAQPSATLTFYQTGSVTKLPIYSTDLLNIELDNPVTATGGGRFPDIYVDTTQTYRVVVKDKNGTVLDDVDPYIPGSVVGLMVGSGITVAATRTVLAGLIVTTGSNSNALLAESGREGVFHWDASDLTALVAADPAQGVYVAPASDTTGASGAWVRKFSGDISVKWFGTVGDGVTDDAAAIQAGLNAINAAGGGTLRFPAGTYKVTTYLTVYPKTVIRGAGRLASVITSAAAGGGGANAHENLRNGSIFHSVQAINSSVAVNISIEDIGLSNTNGSNVGAGYYDRGGTFIDLKRVRIGGFKYSVVLDQSELADIDLCDFESPLTGCVWGVDGADLSAGASTGYLNRLSINRCQFNAGAGAYGIIDDGGNAHAFTDNDFNGCLRHIRAAGVTGLKISGGEFESAASEPIKFDSTSLAGNSVGSCSSVYIGDGAEIIPAAGQYCINAASLGNITLNTVFFGNTAAVKFAGTANTNLICAMNCTSGGGGATFDGRATNHWEAGSDGTTVAVRTNLPITMGGTTAIDASRNATLAAVTATTMVASSAIASSSPTAGFGYSTGAGGTVTQITSRTTGVTLNKVCGSITLFSAAGSATYQSFTVTNSAVAANDTIRVVQKSGTDKNMIHVTAVAAGSFEITFATTGGTTSEQPVFNFNVIKGVAA